MTSQYNTGTHLSNTAWWGGGLWGGWNLLDENAI